MSFLFPGAIWFLAIVPAIVALYLFKQRRRQVTLSTAMFWQAAQAARPSNALFQRLRHVLSLFVNLLIFLLIVAALARPRTRDRGGEGAVSCIVLDAGVAMQATRPGGTTDFEEAKSVAARLLKSANPGRRFALILARATPETIGTPADSTRALRRALEAASPGDSPARLDPAVRLASQLAASGRTPGTVHVITNRAFVAANPGRDGNAPSVATADIGMPRDNVAITRFAARQMLNSPQTGEILVELRTFSGSAARATLEIYDGDTLFDVREISLTPGAPLTLTLPVARQATGAATSPLPASPAPAGGAAVPPSMRFTARLVPAGADALAADNSAYAVLPPASPRRVLLVTNGNRFLESYLMADPLARFELLSPDAYTPALAGGFNAVIFDGVVPGGFDLADPPPGNFLFLGANPFAPAAAGIKNPVVLRIDRDHPLLRLVQFETVSIFRAIALDPARIPDTWRADVVVEGAESPLVVALERAAPADASPHRILLVGFSPADSDFPLRLGFPIFFNNALQWLSGLDPDPLTSRSAGDPFAIPAGWRVTQSPGQPAPEIEAASGPFFVPRKSGFLRLARGGQDERWLAINIEAPDALDLRHPDPGAAPGEAIPAPPRAPGQFPPIGAWPLWRLLALAGLALCSAEWLLFHRRRLE